MQTTATALTLNTIYCLEHTDISITAAEHNNRYGDISISLCVSIVNRCRRII